MAQLLKKLLMGGGGGLKKILADSAPSWMDAEGAIWMYERDGWFDGPEGQIGVFVDEAPSSRGGWFDRV